MAVNKPDVVDAIVVDAASGAVVLAMAEERDWSDSMMLLRDLEAKVNSYLGFVHSGQLDELPEYRHRPIEFELHCQFVPANEAAPALRALKAHLEAQSIGFKVFVGADRSYPLTV